MRQEAGQWDESQGPLTQIKWTLTGVVGRCSSET